MYFIVTKCTCCENFFYFRMSLCRTLPGGQQWKIIIEMLLRWKRKSYEFYCHCRFVRDIRPPDKQSLINVNNYDNGPWCRPHYGMLLPSNRNKR